MKSIIIVVSWISLLLIACGQQKSKTDTAPTKTASAVDESKLTADQVLSKLKAGNDNFVKEISSRNYIHGDDYNYLDQIDHSKADQHPIAFVLACMDSRVPPEIVLDQGIGELFIDRVAGNVEDQFILGSMEYAVNVKHVKLIVVMGHKNCGAIHAAFEKLDSANEELVHLVTHVRQAVISDDPPPYDQSAKHNVVVTIDHILKTSHVIHSKVEAGEVSIVGALYDVSTGKVDWDWKNW